MSSYHAAEAATVEIKSNSPSGHPHQPNLIIKSDHSDEIRYLHHILAAVQDKHVPRGEVWGFTLLLKKDAPPTFIDFITRTNSINLSIPIKHPDCPLVGVRLYNMGTGDFSTGSGIIYYSLNISAVEQGTCPLPVSSTSHRYRSERPIYRSLNLRATVEDCKVGVTFEA